MKSWISKALLGLCIAAPAFAKLPTVPNRYTGIMVETAGLTMTQRSAMINAFGVWFQDMQYHVLNGSNSAFRMVDWDGAEDFGATVKFQLVTGTRAGICPMGDAVDNCAVEILGDDGVNPAPTVKIYTSVKRANGVLATMPLSDRTAFQNIAIRTVGRILGVGLSYQYSGSQALSISRESEWASTLIFPDQLEVAALRGIYSPSVATQPPVAPITDFFKIDSRGTTVGFYRVTSTVGLRLPGSLFRLKSAQWIVNLPGGTCTQDGCSNLHKITLYGSGKVGIFNDNTCYPNTDFSNPFVFYGLKSTEQNTRMALEVLALAGAQLSPMMRYSNTRGDAIEVPHQGGCQSEMGYAVDLMNGN